MGYKTINTILINCLNIFLNQGTKHPLDVLWDTQLKLIVTPQLSNQQNNIKLAYNINELLYWISYIITPICQIK